MEDWERPGCANPNECGLGANRKQETFVNCADLIPSLERPAIYRRRVHLHEQGARVRNHCQQMPLIRANERPLVSGKGDPRWMTGVSEHAPPVTALAICVHVRLVRAANSELMQPQKRQQQRHKVAYSVFHRCFDNKLNRHLSCRHFLT